MGKLKSFLIAKWPVIEHYLISSVGTFLTGFCVALIPQIQSLDVNKLDLSILFGILLVAVRAGFKTFLELFMVPFIKKVNKYFVDRKENKLA